jgi:hypothetical protein
MFDKRSLMAIALATLAGAGSALACINETGTSRSGHQVDLFESVDDVRMGLVKPARTPAWVFDWRDTVVADVRRDPSFDNLNQLAVVLIRLGKVREAITLLHSVERRYPGRWQTAPNLGTAYELAGDNRRALYWIRQGIERNTEDHAGSEWLHAAILEAKMQGRPRVLALDFGPGPLPRLPSRMPAGNDGRPVSAEELRRALLMQARERVQFVAAPDSIVAELLFAWAQMELLAGTMEYAEVVYPAARRYGWPDRAAIQRGMQEAARIRSRHKR